MNFKGVAAPVVPTMNIPNQQPRVENYFHSVALQWRELYRSNGLRSEIFSLRQSVALDWLAKQVPLRGANVLDVGCGAGPASVALAIRGAHVKAIDAVERMVQLTRESAEDAGVSDLVEAQTGDVHSLSFPDESFDAAVAVGIIYWLHSPQRALGELFRVLKPGGCLVVTADNVRRLTSRLDPSNLGCIVKPRRAVGSLLRSLHLRKSVPEITVNSYSPVAFDELLRAAGFAIAKRRTIGFGPFSLFEQKFIPDALGTSLHRYLQRHADGGHEFLATRGNHYIILATKPR